MPDNSNMTENQIVSLYAQGFPQKEHVHVIECVELRGGWESDTYAVTVEYDEATLHVQDEIILKIYHGESGKHKARNEFQSMQELHRQHYPVPRVHLLVMNDSPFGKSCVMMDRIHGCTLAQFLAGATAERQEELMARFCQLYVDLHRLDWRAFVHNPDVYRTEDVTGSWLKGAREAVEQHKLPIFFPVFDWLQARSDDITCEHFSVIHGDFHRSNMLLAEDDTLFVIARGRAVTVDAYWVRAYSNRDYNYSMYSGQEQEGGNNAPSQS